MDSDKKINTYALVSVYDKKNIEYVCNLLIKNNIGIISTGSTSKKIKSLGYNCLEVSTITNFKEVLDGRVKTLHPKIFISILSITPLFFTLSICCLRESILIFLLLFILSHSSLPHPDKWNW